MALNIILRPITAAVARPDTFYVFADDTLTLSALNGLLENDYDTGSATITATSYSSPSNGLLSVSLDGSLTYTPNAGFVGIDTFTYYISDGVHTASAVATIDVVRPSLVASPDIFVAKANSSLTIDAAHGLLANDFSAGGTLVATSYSQTAHGVVSVSLDGSITYTPNSGFVGLDTFTYYISNGHGTASSTATIDVVDAKPIANNDAFSVEAGETLTVAAQYGLLANDTDPGGTLVATSFSQTAHGLVSVSLDGSLTYTPNAGFVGLDTFTYYITDGAQTTSAVATIDVVGQAPVAAADYYRVNENGSLTVTAPNGLLANDFDADGKPIVATSFSQPAHGTLSVSLDGSLTYVPNAGFVGTDTFTYYISDGALTSSAAVALEVGQTTTIANPDTFHDDAGNTLIVAAANGLLANDYSSLSRGGHALTATSYSMPSHGVLSVSLDGSLTYTPNAGFIGVDTFTYYVTDGIGTASAVSTIDVVKPSLVAAPDTFVTKANSSITIDASHGLLANDLSTGGKLVATSFSQTAHGLVSVSLDGSLTYTPNAGFVGLDTFSYYISNGYGTASTTATIDVVDAQPIANNDAFSMEAGKTLIVNAQHGLLANDTDPGGTLVATSFSQTAHGLVSVSLDGSLTYTPNAGFVGLDTFTYYISDGAQTASAIATIDVVDQAPLAGKDYFHVSENGTLKVGAATGLLANDFDPDGKPIVATSFSQAAHGTLSVSLDGSLTYVPNANFYGTDSFTYYISDGTLTASAVATIDVVQCFCAGTLIRTAAGSAQVEDLAIGDMLLTASGQMRAISWIGRRTVVAQFADPVRCWPIRIKAAALGENVPERDLLLSPDHALLIEDILIHAGALVNGLSIVRESFVPEVFVYYHVELDDHSLIFAENALAETFIDNPDRLGFDNWGEHEALYPAGKLIEELTYPRAKSHRQVPARIRSTLIARANLICAAGMSTVA